jgi:hypothetical protein
MDRLVLALWERAGEEAARAHPATPVALVAIGGPIRDYLYRHMRGTSHPAAEGETPAAARGGDDDEVVALLRAIRDDLVDVRRALDRRGEGST